MDWEKMNVLATPNRTRAALLAGAALLLLGGGGALGAWLHPHVVRVTEYQDRVVTVEHTVTVEKPVVEYRDRVVVRTVTKPDGTKVETHVTEESGKRTGGSVTVTDSHRDETVASRVAVTSQPEGRWNVRLLASVDTRGSVAAGAGADYRVAGPLTLGAFATGPVAGNPGGLTVGVSIGLRL